MKTIAEFDQEIQQNPNDADLFYQRGTAYYEMGENDKAFADFNKAIQLNPNDADAYNYRGKLYYAQKTDPAKAIADFTKAIQIDPDYMSPYFGRGMIYSNKGETDKAIADFTRIIQFAPNDPDYAEAYGVRGDLNAQLDNTSEAISDLEKFLQLAPNHEHADLARDTLEQLKGDTSSSGNTSYHRPRRPRSQREKPQGGVEWFVHILFFLIDSHIDLFVTSFWTACLAQRRDWWSTLGRMILFGIVFAIILNFFGATSTAPYVVWAILTLLPIVVISFSRVRDAGKPWWWALIPGANFIMCAFFPSKY